MYGEDLELKVYCQNMHKYVRLWCVEKGKPSVVRKQAKANKSKALLLTVLTILAVGQNFHFSKLSLKIMEPNCHIPHARHP